MGALCDAGVAELQTGPFGTQLHAYDYVDDGVPVVPTEAIRGRQIDHSVLPKITRTKAQELERHRLRSGDILFARRGVQATGHIGCVRAAEDGFICGTGAIRLRVASASDEIDPDYLSHVLADPSSVEWFKFHAIGATMPNLNEGIIRSFQLSVPPLPEQRAIAHILGALDDKIELNRRMSETLEAMAQALFKSWFVDFEPVRAKVEGRWQRGQSLPGLPAHLYDLFPDRLVDSELGEIPEGWEVTSIYEVADVIYGAPFASVQFNTDGVGTPLIRIRDLARENPGVWTPEVHQKGYKVRPGDIVVGMDGEFRAYLWGGPDAWLNQRLCVFVPKSWGSAAFVRNSIIKPLAEIEATETATTVIHLGKSDIDRFMIVAPTAVVLNAFSQVCQPWYDRIVATKREATILIGLRDALLTKLISGELRVPDTERFVEASL